MKDDTTINDGGITKMQHDETAPAKCWDTTAAEASIPGGATVADGSAMTEAPAEWQVGDVILDTYEVTGILGKGGMGKVYKAYHRNWNLDFAVKCPLPEIVEKAGGKDNFVREAETWVNLGLHPHIVSCHYVRTLGGMPRVFAEYIDGGSLADRIADGRLYGGGKEKALERILDIAIQFAWGLHYAHEQGIIHQDVKPANVMMTMDATAKVTDFGLARARAIHQEQDGREGTIMATWGGMTPAYCSPEQAGIGTMARAGVPEQQRPKLTRQTDIWSWAVSVLEMFVGERTWAAGHIAGYALEAYLENGADREALPHMPRDMGALLKRCLLEAPPERPSSLYDIAEELQEIYRQAVGKAYPRKAPKASDLIADSLNNRALSLLDIGRAQEAEAYWQNALKADPQHLYATYNYGLALWRNGVISDQDIVKRVANIKCAKSSQWLKDYYLMQIHLERGDEKAAENILDGLSEEVKQREEFVQLKENVADKSRCAWESSVALFEGMRQGSGLALLHDQYLVVRRFAMCDPYESSLIEIWDMLAQSRFRAFEGSNLQQGNRYTDIVADKGFSYLLSAERRKERVRLWSIESGKCLWMLENESPYDSYRQCFRFSGNRVAIGRTDGYIEFRDCGTGSLLGEYKLHENSITSMCVAGDGQCGAAGTRDGHIILFEPATGKITGKLAGHNLNGIPGEVKALCMDDGGRFLLSSSGRTIKFWSVENGECLWSRVIEEDWILSMQINSKSFYGLSNLSGAIKQWDLKNGRCLRTFEIDDEMGEAVITCGGGVIAAYNDLDDEDDDAEDATDDDGDDDDNGDNNRLQVLTYRPGERFRANFDLSRPAYISEIFDAQSRFEELKSRILQAKNKGDDCLTGKLVLQARSIPEYKNNAELFEIWQNLYGKFPKKGFNAVHHASPPPVAGLLQLSFDSRYAVVSEGVTKRSVWDLHNNHQLAGWEPGSDFCFSGNSRFILSAKHDAARLIRKTGNSAEYQQYSAFEVCKLPSLDVVCSIEEPYDETRALCLSPDGAVAFIAYRQKGAAHKDVKLRAFNTASGEQLWCVPASERARFLSVSADGKYVLCHDKHIKVFDAFTGNCLFTIKIDTLSSCEKVLMTPDGKYILFVDEFLKLCDASGGECVKTIRGPKHFVNCFDLSSDGLYAVTGGTDATLKLWHVPTGKCLHTFEGHLSELRMVQFSCDGSYILSRSSDRAEKIWYLDWELDLKEA